MKLENIHKVLEIVKPLLNSAVEVGVVQLTKQGEAIENEYGVKLDGFYNHYFVVLTMNDEGQMIITGNRGEHLETLWDPNFLGVLQANYGEYLTFKDRNPGAEPNSAWLPFLLEHKVVKRKETVVVSYE